MSTYYKHTRVEDANILYNFQCESCMKNSGELKLQKEAHKNLVRKVKEIHKDAKEKDIYST